MSELASVLERKAAILVKSLEKVTTVRPNTDRFDRLITYVELLHRWAERVDLVSPAPSEVQIERHITDSLAAWMLITESCQLLTDRAFMDVGSGAGLPGVVFAALEPSRKVLLVEPRDKRSIFLKEVKRILELENVVILNKTIQEVTKKEVGDLGLVVSRALTIDELMVSLASKLLGDPGFIALMVTPHWDLKLHLGRFADYSNRQFDYVLPESRAGRRLVVVDYSK